MPIENESKYVIQKNGESESQAKDQANKIYEIKQGYLGEGATSVRLRSASSGKETHHYLTVKHRLNGHVWEVETKIEARDYNALWAQTTNRLEKVRCVIEGWDVDFFYSDGKRYFAMAEYEMPEGQKKPKTILSFVAKRLLYAVPRDDTRFTSKKLADVKYAEKLYSVFSK